MNLYTHFSAGSDFGHWMYDDNRHRSIYLVAAPLLCEMPLATIETNSLFFPQKAIIFAQKISSPKIDQFQSGRKVRSRELREFHGKIMRGKINSCEASQRTVRPRNEVTRSRSWQAVSKSLIS